MTSEHHKVRVALVPDTPGWAWHSMALGIQKYAPDWAACDVLMPNELTVATAEPYHTLLQFSWAEGNTRLGYKSAAVVASHACEHLPWRCMVEHRPAASHEAERWEAAVASNLSNRHTAAAILPRYARLLCTSQRLVSVVAPLAKQRPVHYTPAGIDESLWTVSPVRPAGDKLRVGWCGQHEYGKPDAKGVDWILEPLKQVLGVEVEWVINMRTAEHALTQAEMNQWYRSIDVLLVTSISEGTPMPMLEAMACGRAVLATRVGDAPNVITDGISGIDLGQYTGPLTAECVISRAAVWIRTLLHNRDLTSKMGWHAAEAVRSFRSWRNLAGLWIQAATSSRF